MKHVKEVPVTQLTKNLEEYLSEVTGLNIKAKPLESGDLPYFFSRQYALYRLLIGNTEVLAVFLLQQDEFKPAQFLKHMRQAPSLGVGEICVVAQALPTYVRKRLIERGIAFVIPRVQMYLPSLGMDLRERYRKSRSMVVERFSPATQVVMIHCLLGRIQGTVTPLELSKQLHYSSMTMSRALDELESTGIALVERSGKERLLTFNDERRAIWDQALLKLRNPISYTVLVFERDLKRKDLLPAGITALSTQSMLNEPLHPEYAISRNAWNVMKEKGIEKIPIEDSGTCVLQIWCYAPKILEIDGGIDPFSLYLSLQDTNDERIEMALENLMEQYL